LTAGAGAILDKRYGDCKDHATLMEALLQTAGIASTPVLINAGNSYKLSPVAQDGQVRNRYAVQLDADGGARTTAC
jgi:transglutaminase-like putative cysteine protease